MCDDSPNSTFLTILTISWENTKIPPKLIFGSHYEKGFSFHKKVLFLTVWYRTRFIGSTVCVHYLRDQKQPDCNYDFVLKIAIFVKFSMYRPLFFVSKILYVRTFFMYLPLLFFTNKQIANNSYTRVACTNNKTAASEKYTRKEKHKTGNT
jgi:hypothetical protein